VHPTQPVEIFGNFSSPSGTLAIHWHSQNKSVLCYKLVFVEIQTFKKVFHVSGYVGYTTMPRASTDSVIAVSYRFGVNRFFFDCRCLRLLRLSDANAVLSAPRILARSPHTIRHRRLNRRSRGVARMRWHQTSFLAVSGLHGQQRAARLTESRNSCRLEIELSFCLQMTVYRLIGCLDRRNSRLITWAIF